MSGIQYQSAWSEDADGVGPQPEEVVLPERDTNSVQRTQPPAKDGSPVRLSSVPVAPPSASAPFSDALRLLLDGARRPHESWRAFGKRLGVPQSLLARCRRGQGFSIASADKIAATLRVTVTLHWEAV